MYVVELVDQSGVERLLTSSAPPDMFDVNGMPAPLTADLLQGSDVVVETTDGRTMRAIQVVRCQPKVFGESETEK